MTKVSATSGNNYEAIHSQNEKDREAKTDKQAADLEKTGRGLKTFGKVAKVGLGAVGYAEAGEAVDQGCGYGGDACSVAASGVKKDWAGAVTTAGMATAQAGSDVNSGNFAISKEGRANIAADEAKKAGIAADSLQSEYKKETIDLGNGVTTTRGDMDKINETDSAPDTEEYHKLRTREQHYSDRAAALRQ